MLHLLGNQVKDFDAVDDLKRQRLAGRDHDGRVVLPRAPRRQRFDMHRAAAVAWLPVRARRAGCAALRRRSIAPWRLGRCGLGTCRQRRDATDGGSGETEQMPSGECAWPW